jgi:hypothetical protein
MLARRSSILAGAVAGLLFTLPMRSEAQSLVTTPFGGFATDFAAACPSLLCVNPAPITVGTAGHDVTLSANTPDHRISSGSHQLGSNGFIEGGIWAAVNTPEGALTFDFESPVTAVGAFMNYRPDPGYGAPLISAWNGSVFLGLWNLALEAPIETAGGYNQFAFRGVEYTGGITRLTLSGGNIVTRDLQVMSAAASVPEPETLALLALGGLTMVLAPRRRHTA